MSTKLPESIAGIFFGGPSWSPDGKVIATAVRRRESSGTEGARLIQVAVDTGAVTTLSDPGWLTAAQCGWLPDGKSLLVIARAPDQIGSQIWAVSYPGGEARRVTSGLNEHRIISLTRDGRTLVSVADVQMLNILRMPVSGASPPVRVSRSTLDGQNGVAFAPDGAIVYTSVTKGGASLWRVSADGADRGPVVTANEGELLRFPSVTDDGTVYYLASSRSGVEVRSTSADGASTRVVARDAQVAPVGTSADGRVVMYTALEKGVPTLFRMAPDGSNRKAVTTLEVSQASVEPSGQRIGFYYEDDDHRVRYGVMAMDGGALVADLPTEELPARSARLVLRPEGFYVTSVPGDRANVWLLPLDGRPARKVTSFVDQTIVELAVSRDGSTIAVVRGPRLRDAQLFRGFASGGGQ
jgi:Tol biopolymer transport system component